MTIWIAAWILAGQPTITSGDGWTITFWIILAVEILGGLVTPSRRQMDEKLDKILRYQHRH